ncbi:MAG: NHLP bacteriocin export ABC transporter permease/ATPase subunit [Desulfobacteraceae bacterium]|nr:NHLP bacteriocin export ABC transporter permease/ATPase subunit [Desulfobacteraceae bacterium]
MNVNKLDKESLYKQLEQIEGVEKHFLASNQMVSLQDRTGIYLLLEGDINHFYTADHEPPSRLFALNSSSAGHFFLSGQTGFSCVPAINSSCLYIPFSSIKLIKDEHLIELVCCGIDQYITQEALLLLTELNQKNKQEISSYWQHTDQTYLPQWMIIPEDESGQALIYNSQELLQKNLLIDSLKHFQCALEEKTRHWQLSQMSSELHDLEKNTQDKQQKLQQSLGYFVQILKEKSQNIEQHPNLLYQSCLVLGSKTGIDFKLPKVIPNSDDELLQEIVRASHIHMRRVTLKGDWYLKESGTLLGFWHDSGAPVSLLCNGSHGFQLYDPETDRYHKVDASIEKKLSSNAVCFYRPLPEHNLNGKDLIHFALVNNIKELWVLFFMSCGIGLMGLLIPLATGMVYDDLIPGSNVVQLWQLGVGLLVAAVVVATFQYTQGVAVNRLEGLVTAPLESALWDRVLNCRSTFFRRYGSGDLASRLSVIRSIHQLVSGTVISALLAMGAGLFNFILMYYIDWKLALVASVISVILVSVVVTGFIFQIKHYRKVIDIKFHLQAHVLQIINAIGRLKINGSEIYAFSSWAKQYAAQRKHTFNAGKIANQVDSFSSTIQVLALGCFIFVVIHYNQSHFSVGEFLKFSSAYAIFLASTILMANALMSLGMVSPLYKMLQPILKEVPEIDLQKIHPGKLTGQIEIAKLSFRYEKEGMDVIKDFNLEIKPGSFVAIVGSSGCGKSTLLRLLLGFEQPHKGTILYDHQELETLDILELRRQLGVVLQGGSIMSGSILENITGATGCSREEAMEAAKIASLADDIEQMPMKYNTIVQDGTLSGGQQQRLIIARSIVKKPLLLFYDEATSALDNATQLSISQSIEKLNVTRIIIAHRLSTIKHADVIVVLDKGTIVQKGTYQQLIQEQGLFLDLVKRQIN